MIAGAILGAVIGVVVAVVYALFFAKGTPCPRCGRPLPLPWLVPPRVCPRCGQELNERGTKRPADGEAGDEDRGRLPASAAPAWILGLALLAALGGLGLAGYFLPGALESRRVWLYQEGRVEEQFSAMRALEQPGAAAQGRLRQAREQFHKDDWHPEIYHEAFVQRLLLVAAGGFLFLVGGTLLLVRWVVGRARASGPGR